jgi:hypothetical protein
MQKAISGFGTAGILPLNPEMFSEFDFEHARQTNNAV